MITSETGLNISFSWQDIWRLVKRWWWLAVIGTVLAGVTNYYFASRKPNIYAARTRLMVGSSIRSSDPNSQDFRLSITLAQAYAEMVRQRPIAQGVVDRLELPMGWWELAGSVHAGVIPNAQLLEITVFHTDPEFAALAANAVAEELILQSPASSQEGIDREFIRQELVDTQGKVENTQAQIEELRDSMVDLASATELEDARTQLEELERLKGIYSSSYVELASLLNTQSPNTLTVVEPASPSWNPIAPNPKREAMMAAVAGLALAVGAILVLEFVDDTLRLEDVGVESLLGLPILGTVARMPNARCEPRSPAAEMIRQLRTKVLLSSPRGRLESLVVTSPMPKDGKTIVAANLAVTLAAGGARVVLVDTDLRAPSLHEWFDLPNVVGLTDLLSTDRARCEQLLPQVLRDTGVPGLSFISAGRPPLDPSILLASPRMPELLVLLSRQFEFVLFDSPPVSVAPDATILATLAEGTLLVVSPGKSSSKATGRARDRLASQEDTRLIGVALNRVPLRRYAYSYAQLVEETVSQQGRWAQLGHRLKLNRITSRLPIIGKPPAPDLIPLSQAASMLGVHNKTARRWCEEGRLPGFRHQLRWWVRRDGLESMVLGRSVTKMHADPQVLDEIHDQVEDDSNGRSLPASVPQPVISSTPKVPVPDPVAESPDDGQEIRHDQPVPE